MGKWLRITSAFWSPFLKKATAFLVTFFLRNPHSKQSGGAQGKSCSFFQKKLQLFCEKAAAFPFSSCQRTLNYPSATIGTNKSNYSFPKGNCSSTANASQPAIMKLGIDTKVYSFLLGASFP